MIDPIDNNLSTKSDIPAEEFSGQLLKHTRESMKITQEEVAERLHLDIDVIRALENDNFAALPGRTYIKGYQRSYATLLGIPVKEISSSGSESENSGQLLPENINDRNARKVKWFTYLLVSVGLLVVLAIFSAFVHVNNTNQKQKEAEASNKTRTATVMTSRAKSGENNNEMSKSSEAGITEPVPRLQAADDKISKNKPAKFTGLVLKYEKSSWTEVYDANGKKLVFGMIKHGETIQVEGLQPFSVLLGNAEAVKVEFAGKSFSTEKYIRNGMAQFVIGSSFNNKK